MTQFLSIFLSRLRQPRVIAEVVAGVVLGPTAMGRIPGFTQAIFPEASLPVLSLTSTIGLILYLFLVGLEIDTRLMRKNIMSSVSVSIAGLVVPLAQVKQLVVAEEASRTSVELLGMAWRRVEMAAIAHEARRPEHLAQLETYHPTRSDR